MVTTYRSRANNVYLFDITNDSYKMNLSPFIWCINEPCKITLNRVHHDNKMVIISKEKYFNERVFKGITRKHLITYAPTVIE